MLTVSRTTAVVLFAVVFLKSPAAWAAGDAEPFADAIFSYCLVGVIALSMIAFLLTIRGALAPRLEPS
jgi:hypothetical protein